MNKFSIGNKKIGKSNPCFIIAEVGVNHNGDPALAKDMVDAIADAGADCVKFQTFRAEEFCNSPDETYTYKSQGKKVTESMLAMFKRLEFARDEFAGLFEHARSRGLIPFSTPTDKFAVDLLMELDAPAFKIGSDDLVYTPFLEYVASKGKPIIISTGMATATDVDIAVDAITKAGNDQLAILHCVSLYPTPEDKVNLRRIQTFQTMYDNPVGFSDHSDGITAALGAVSLGACILEKHFTMDKNMPGPDHWFSMDPEELRTLVQEVRRLEANLGSGRIWPSAEEQEMAALARRSIIAAENLPKGHVITMEDLLFQRPGTGLLASQVHSVVGSTTTRLIEKGSLLSSADFKEM